ncbi:hypothetical protein I79_025705 [Cricetulus griseus]|uniref:Uncharacterized protein n=1 Tax=Cricetulus griseus TaxID=10029 RepID=G3IP06_CRIGR|nr:hypothetical protein I79_025705 [Cricetulus griseus]
MWSEKTEHPPYTQSVVLWGKKSTLLTRETITIDEIKSFHRLLHKIHLKGMYGY